MKEAIKAWVRNEKEIEEAIIDGEEVEVLESDFGASELLVDFLKASKSSEIPEVRPDFFP